MKLPSNILEYNGNSFYICFTFYNKFILIEHRCDLKIIKMSALNLLQTDSYIWSFSRSLAVLKLILFNRRLWSLEVWQHKCKKTLRTTIF